MESQDLAPLLDDLEVVVWQVGLGGKLEYSNARWKEYIGDSPVSSLLEDFLHPDERQSVQSRWQQIIHQAKPQSFEFRLRSKSGDYGWFLCRAVPRKADSAVVGWAATCLDISERKQGEQQREHLLLALQAARVRLESVLQELPIGALIAEAPSGQVVLLNRRAEIILGNMLGSELGQERQVFGNLSGSEGVLAPDEYPVAMVLRTGQTLRNLELRQGDTTWLLLNAGPLYGGAGQIEAVLVTFADITERKQDEERLRQSEERYRLLAESQKRFVADASHELRAPLTAIQGNLELLRRFKQMNKEDREATLAEAEREAARLGRLVADLLSLARGDAGYTLELAPVALHEIAQESLNQVRHIGGAHHLELASLEPVWVLGHRDRLKQLLLILLDNAIKYTPKGGRIALEVLHRKNQAELRVVDCGIGIAQDDLPHVFERFYRADPSRSEGSGGSGLGLAIAQWIVEQHGGRIELLSQLGEGTTAAVYFQLSPSLGPGL